MPVPAWRGLFLKFSTLAEGSGPLRWRVALKVSATAYVQRTKNELNPLLLHK
jgi:hypothetical protein